MKDERIKVGLFIAILFIIQGILFYTMSAKMVNSAHEKYMEQNTSIVGEIAKYEKGISEKIIPVITGKETGDYERGKEVLAKYSYTTDLDVKMNPLFEGEIGSLNKSFVMITLIGLLVVLVGSFFLMNPVFREINYLTKSAEIIVENKKNRDKRRHTYIGSLDKFVVKFDLMEERVKNSIHLLQQEKVNLKDIINDISHQLKTPLTALSMYNDILNDHREMEEKEVDEFIHLSKEQLERMDWLVKTLLKYARLESNVVEYHKQTFSLNNTIEESMNPLRIKAEEKQQQFIFHPAPEIDYYHDRKWIGEAISNIIKNAIEHTDKGGKIEISLEETPLSITIAIKDNGEGIEKSEQHKIFNRFHKGENSLLPTSIGIGLSLSRSIIRAHNGDITVESKLGVGSTFYITFLKTGSHL